MKSRKRKILKAPLTSEKQYTKTRKEINKTNKDRARAMERRIAKYLRGSRVPMSGAAAQWKGDCIVPLINNPGIYLVECKLTASRIKSSAGKNTEKLTDPSKTVKSEEVGNMAIQLKWFTKLRSEVQAMNAKFGILVIHYHNFTGDYVFIDVEYVRRIITQYAIDQKYVIDLLHLIDYGKRYEPRITGVQNKMFNMTNQFIRDIMVSLSTIKSFCIRLMERDYLVLPLQDYRNIVWEL